MDIPPFAKKSGDVQEDPRTGYCWWGTLTHTFNQWVSQILLLQKGHTWHTFNFFFCEILNDLCIAEEINLYTQA